MIMSNQILLVTVFESNIHNTNEGRRGRCVGAVGLPYGVRGRSRHAVCNMQQLIVLLQRDQGHVPSQFSGTSGVLAGRGLRVQRGLL